MRHHTSFIAVLEATNNPYHSLDNMDAIVRSNTRTKGDASMSHLSIWVAKAVHKDPSDFYVKVDSSDYYTAYWVVRASDKDAASSLVEDVSTELELGSVEVSQIYQYPNELDVSDEAVRRQIEEGLSKLEEGEDVQLSAWVSKNGGLW